MLTNLEKLKRHVPELRNIRDLAEFLKLGKRNLIIILSRVPSSEMTLCMWLQQESDKLQSWPVLPEFRSMDHYDGHNQLMQWSPNQEVWKEVKINSLCDFELNISYTHEASSSVVTNPVTSPLLWSQDELNLLKRCYSNDFMRLVAKTSPAEYSVTLTNLGMSLRADIVTAPFGTAIPACLQA